MPVCGTSRWLGPPVRQVGAWRPRDFSVRRVAQPDSALAWGARGRERAACSASRVGRTLPGLARRCRFRDCAATDRRGGALHAARRRRRAWPHVALIQWGEGGGRRCRSRMAGGFRGHGGLLRGDSAIREARKVRRCSLSSAGHAGWSCIRCAWRLQCKWCDPCG